jgi:hypothetical protein
MYQGQMDGIGFYFGIQTDVWRPGVGWRGKGLIFSRWKTRDRADARPAPGGWVESSGHEGDFVGVRKQCAWTSHRYRFHLAAIDEDAVGLWYGLSMLDYDTGAEESAGALRFPMVDSGRPRIQTGGGSWIEIYSGAEHVTDIPDWHVSIDGCFAGSRGMQARECEVSYSEVPASDIYLDSGDRSVHMLIGASVTRRHEPGTLFIGENGLP